MDGRGRTKQEPKSRAMQGAIAEGRDSVAALGKDWAIADGRRLDSTDWVGSASATITLTEY